MQHSRSPILALENAIAGAPFRIAPERETELAEFRDAKDVTVVLDDGRGFRFDVNPETSEITTTVASLEFLWASAHGHLLLYDEYCKAQQSGAEQFDTGASARCRASLDLLNWSVQNLAQTGTAIWPKDLPQPVRYPEERTDIHVANELFLCGVAWIIHHELAHIRLDHSSLITSRSIEEEEEADIQATKWILDKSNNEQESRKRTIGIAAAILALQGIAESSRYDPLQTHPRAFERIDYCLTESGVSDEDEVYAFAACIMQIQLTYRGVNIAHGGNSFRELFSEYLFEFARL